MAADLPVRWGVLGCARVFERRMMSGYKQAANAEVTALASRDAAKAEECAARHGIARAYGSYEALLADSEIEAVYLPLPNHLHAEWTLRAFEAGKHVLCDKPLALTYADAKRMADAARAANRRLMEAFMYRHHPQHAHIGEMVRRGEIGSVAHFRGTFTFPGQGLTGYRRDAAKGGGALYDVGVYPLNAARFHFGAEPVVVAAVAGRDAETGVDEHTAAVLEFEDGRTASIECGFDQTFTTCYELAGSEGTITTERAFQPGDGPVTVTIRKGEDVRTETTAGADHYQREIEHFSACVRDPARDLWPGEDGTAQMRVVEAIQRSLREKRHVEVAEVEA